MSSVEEIWIHVRKVMPEITIEDIQLNLYVRKWIRSNHFLFDYANNNGLDLEAEIFIFCQTIMNGKYKEII